MIVEDQMISLRWGSKNKSILVSKGYPFTKFGDTVDVRLQDASKQAKALVKIQCDYCLRVFDRKLSNHYKQMESSPIKKDSCTKCAGIKRKESNLLVYGVDSLMKLEETRQKVKNTVLDRYGVEHPMYSEEIKNKVKNDFIDKYGVSNPNKLPEVKQKIVETNLARYGVEYYTQTDEYKEKSKETSLRKFGVENAMFNEDIKTKLGNTNLEKYGVVNVFQNSAVKKKIKATMLNKYNVETPMHYPAFNLKSKINRSKSLYKNGTTQTSKQQLYLQGIINGELNYSIDHINVDIALLDAKIVIEYDGGGHNLKVKMGLTTPDQFKISERKRYFFLKSQGWKEIRIISDKDYLPSEVMIREIMSTSFVLLSGGCNWIHFNIDTGKMITKYNEIDFDFGELAKLA